MNLERTPVTVLLLLAAVAAVQMIHYYPQLPDTLAVHFGASGEPDGWSGKTEFVVLYGAMEAFFVLLGFGLAWMLRKIPASYVNIPNREYWLADERRPETVEFISNHVIWIQAATLGFLIAIAQSVFLANMSDAAPRLPIRCFALSQSIHHRSGPGLRGRQTCPNWCAICARDPHVSENVRARV